MRFFFEPTDRRKAIKLLHNGQRIAFSSPNVAELRAMATYLRPNMHFTTEINHAEEIFKLTQIVAQAVDFLIVTLGSEGVITATNVATKLYKVETLNSVKNVSGAGDCFASGFIHGILSGLKESECVHIGFKTAKSAVLSENTVPINFDVSDVREALCEEL